VHNFEILFTYHVNTLTTNGNSWFIHYSPKDEISDLEQLSPTHSAVELDPCDDSKPPRYDILMTEVGKEAISNSDEFLNDIKAYDDVHFASPRDIELEVNKASLDEVVQEASTDPNNIGIKKTSRSSLPTVEQVVTEELLPTNTSSMNVSESQAQLERMKGRSSITIHQADATNGKLRRGKITTSSGARKSRSSCHMSHYHSKFLNDNEFHVIWKPEIRSVNELIHKKPTTPTMLPATDPGSPLQESNITSPENEVTSATGAPADLWLRQKQLQERINIAREVAKDQSVTLVKPEVSQGEKRCVLQLSSKIVSYRVSKKPKHLDDVVLQAMKSAADSCKSLLTESDQPLSSKEKWKRAILLSVIKREELRLPSTISLASSHPEMQPVSIRKISKSMKRISKKPFLGSVPQSQSLSALSNNPPISKRHELRSRNIYTTMNTKPPLEDVVEVDENKPDKETLVTNTDNIKTATNSTSIITTGENKEQVADKQAAANSSRNSYSDNGYPLLVNIVHTISQEPSVIYPC